MRHATPTVAALLLVAACGLDTSGIGNASGSLVSGTTGATSGADSVDSSTTAAGTTAHGGTEGDDTTAAATTVNSDPADADTGSSGDDASSSTTTTEPVDPCADNPPFTLVLEANTAVLTPPMAQGTLLDGTTEYVYGETANAGGASFEVELPCTDEYMVWADVFDGEPGPDDIAFWAGDPADALRIELGGVVTEWTYGCQTAGPGLWSRQAVSTHDFGCLIDDKVVYDLDAGTHTLSIVPLEGGGHTGWIIPGDVAAVERVIITNQLRVQP